MSNYLKAMITICLVTVVIPLSACSNHSDGEAPIAIMNTSNSTAKADAITTHSNDRELIEKVRKDLLSIDPIYDAVIIKGKKETLVAYKVKHLHRFRMKQIEQQINQRLEKEYPDENFIISNDFKIFLETSRLINKTKQTNYSDKKANKDLQKIIELKNELT